MLAVASFERTSTSGALGSCGWGMAARVNSAIAPGRKTTQWGAAVLEVAEFLTLRHVVAGLDVGVDDAGGDVRHADRHEGHQADDGIVGIDEDGRPCGDMRQVGLEFVGSTASAPSESASE